MARHARLHIDTARCTGCGRCVAACPGRIVTLEVAGFRKHAALSSPLACNLCGKCLSACPVTALTLGNAGEDAALPRPEGEGRTEEVGG